MQKQHTIVALSIAAVAFTGIGAGIAAIGNEVAGSITSPATVQAEPLAVTEVLMPTGPVERIETPTPVAMAETQPAQSHVALTPVDSVAPVPAAEPQRVAMRAKDDEYYVRLPFTNRQIKLTVPTFPSNSAEYPDPMPSVVAYYDRRNANRVLVGAAGPVFPTSGGEDSHETSPAVVAYFDRLEARRLAAIQQATPPVAAAQPATGEAVVASVSNGIVR